MSFNFLFTYSTGPIHFCCPIPFSSEAELAAFCVEKRCSRYLVSIRWQFSVHKLSSVIYGPTKLKRPKWTQRNTEVWCCVPSRYKQIVLQSTITGDYRRQTYWKTFFTQKHSTRIFQKTQDLLPSVFTGKGLRFREKKKSTFQLPLNFKLKTVVNFSIYSRRQQESSPSHSWIKLLSISNIDLMFKWYQILFK